MSFLLRRSGIRLGPEGNARNEIVGKHGADHAIVNVTSGLGFVPAAKMPVLPRNCASRYLECADESLVTLRSPTSEVHVRGAIGAAERRPQTTKNESATSRKLNGVFAASPREK